MRNPDRNPFDSACPSLFADYPATSSIGINVRRGDAQLRLKAMAEAEEAVLRQERLNAAIADRIQRMQAGHEFEMQYLIQFGVKASEREVFRRTLEEVSRHGGLNLREAANLAQARCRAERPASGTQRNGVSSAGGATG